MRKSYYLFIQLMLITVFGFSQTNLPVVNPQSLNYPITPSHTKNVMNKTVSCTDTVQYPLSKMTGLPEIDTMEISNYISGVAQVYYFSGTGTIDGLNAYIFLDADGIPGNSTPIIMTIKVYDVNASLEPSTMIDSADVQVLDLGFVPQKLMFSSPVAVSDTFAVAIEVNATTPANPYYVTNTSANADGAGERLSSAEYLGVWYNAFDDFGGWDMDVMLEPIMNTDLTSIFTSSLPAACPNDTVNFLSASTVNTDAMFNLYGGANSLYSWDFDDGTGPYNPYDTSYAWSAPGSYNVGLTVTYYGYTTNCFETSNFNVNVHDTAIANFGWTFGGVNLFDFYDSSSTAMTYLWDFGDGSPIDSTQNPSHTFSTLPAYVCLTVLDSNGCNSNTYCDSVFTTSVKETSQVNRVNIYPIPAKKSFFVDVPSKYFNGEISISDVVGKTLKKSEHSGPRKSQGIH